VKSFIEFPVLNEGNEIWYLVYDGKESSLNLLTDKLKPFNEKDFDKYFDKLFPKTFIRSILKLKTVELFTKGKCETIELKEGSITYKTYAVFDSKENTLTLSMAYYDTIKATDGNGQEIQDPVEYNVIYIFNVLKNGQLKFSQIQLAG